jgi:hypothetical protein
MAAPTGTFTTFSAAGNREDLTDGIYNISPTDTPFMNSIGRTKAKSVQHDWQTDSLASASTSNAQIQGDDVSGTTSSPTTRVINMCQISRKDAVVSGTQEIVDKAGRDSEMAYQMAKRAKELKRDMESILTGNQGYVSGSSTLAMKLRSLESWLSSNVARNDVTTTAKGASTGATTAGANSTVGTNAATDASTTRPIIEDYLKSVVKSAWDNGGEPSVIMCGSYIKQQISGFTGRSQSQQIIGAKTINAAADMYASDFGDLKVIPNRFQRARSCFVLDPEYAAVAYLRPFMKKDLAVTGDSIKKFILAEYTLEMKNEAAHGVIADLTTA